MRDQLANTLRPQPEPPYALPHDIEGVNVGFSYRKSFKAGPFRVTASKSGVSYSAGVKGARVTKRVNGKVQTTLSAGGVRYTTTGSKTTTRKQASTKAAPRTTVPRQTKPAGPTMPTADQLRASWRATGRILPTRDPRINQATAETVAGLMLILAKPGEDTLLLVRINNMSPLRDTMVLTNQRILLLHSRQALRNNLVHAIRREPGTVVQVKSGILSNKLIIQDTDETLVAGGLNPATVKWLRSITAHDPLFQL